MAVNNTYAKGAVILAMLALMFVATACSNANSVTGAFSANSGANGNVRLTLDVAIPCPGHAQLIMSALKGLAGVTAVNYRPISYFDVTYDEQIVSRERILSLDVFKIYKATVV